MPITNFSRNLTTMKLPKILTVLILFLITLPGFSQVPQLVHYQGRIAVNDVNFEGLGYFKFALVSGNGATTYWSHDGSSANGAEPTTFLKLDVTSGLYSVLLGDVNVVGMDVLPASVFENPDVRLRIWFNDQTTGFQQLAPDQRIAAVGYAMIAATAQTIAEGAVTGVSIASNSVDAVHLRAGSVQSSQLDSESVVTTKIADGAVTGPKLADGSVTTSKLAPQAVTQSKIADGAVGPWQIEAGAVTAEKLAEGAVVAQVIAEGGISGSMLAPDAAKSNLEASGHIGVSQGGLILAEAENPALEASGYLRLGVVTMDGGWRRVDTGTAPFARFGHSAVWTGQEWIIWGGLTFTGRTNTGARYNPASKRWTPISTVNAPAARNLHTAVWTGSEMLVWGGNTEGGATSTGFRYDPVTDSWSALPGTGLSGRHSHSAVWTGTEMIIWGGQSGTSTFNSGSRYNPATNTWSNTSTAFPPSARKGHTAVWTGTEMIIWGGANHNGTILYQVGGRYDPQTNQWVYFETANSPVARLGHSMVWTGSEVIVWGGTASGGVDQNTGGRYNPETNTWIALGTGSAPAARSGHTAVWALGRMWVWGGYGSASFLSSGASYDPATNAWSALTAAPYASTDHQAVWTGQEMLVFGGQPYQTRVQSFRPSLDAWESHSPGTAPEYRLGHRLVWIGDRVMVWGGVSVDALEELVYPSSGGIFNPTTGTWTSISNVNAPMGREDFSMIWTGTEVIVWAGRRLDENADFEYLNDGARYNPTTDTWTDINIASFPMQRALHTAIWTGTDMLVWGGMTVDFQGNEVLQPYTDRYNPATDQWGEFDSGRPGERLYHTAVWDGTEMLIYGGESLGGAKLSDGKRYDPATNTWSSPVGSLLNPSFSGGSALWTKGRVWTVANIGDDTTLSTYSSETNRWRSYGVLSADFTRFHEGILAGNKMIAFGRDSLKAQSQQSGVEVDFEALSLRPIPSLPGVPYHFADGMGVWSGKEVLKFVGTETGSSEVYGYTPSRTLHLYQKP